MIINGNALLKLAPIKDMETSKKVINGMSYGLSEAGYDIRIKQDVHLHNDCRFVLASSIEEFQMPNMILGRVCDKSSWARKGLSVFNTVIEPGWNGFLTLELVFHCKDNLFIPSGSPIAQVIFETIYTPATYNGKYQNQEDMPVYAIHEE